MDLNIFSDFSIWLGLTDMDFETVFRTTEGFTTPWVNWDSGQPGGGTPGNPIIEDCVERKAMGNWNDDSCSNLKKFFCETKSKFHMKLY